MPCPCDFPFYPRKLNKYPLHLPPALHSPPKKKIVFHFSLSTFSLLTLSSKRVSMRKMAANMMLYITITVLLCFLTAVNARIPGVYTGGPWQTAHATFYGGSDASGTMGNYYSFSQLQSLNPVAFTKTMLSSSLNIYKYQIQNSVIGIRSEKLYLKNRSCVQL